MNHNTLSVQNPNMQAQPAAYEQVSTEEQARQRIVGEIVAATEVGSVAFYSSQLGDMNGYEKEQMRTAIGTRQHQAGLEGPALSDGLQDGRTGWNSYGERNLLDSHDTVGKTLTNRLGHNGLPAQRVPGDPESKGAENLAFFELPDGRVDVRYALMPEDGYNDKSRRGSSLHAGFILSATEASRLLQAVENTPGVLTDILEAQAMAVGVTENNWKTRLNPRVKDMRDEFHKTDKDRELGITAYDTSVIESGTATHRQMGSELVVRHDKSESLIPIANHVDTMTDSFMSNEVKSQSEQVSDNIERMLKDLAEGYKTADDPIGALADLEQRIKTWQEVTDDGLWSKHQLDIAVASAGTMIDKLLARSAEEMVDGWDAMPTTKKIAYYSDRATVLRADTEPKNPVMHKMMMESYRRLARKDLYAVGRKLGRGAFLGGGVSR